MLLDTPIGFEFTTPPYEGDCINNICNKYHCVSTIASQLIGLHHLNSRSGQKSIFGVHLTKVLWLSPNQKCDVFWPDYSLADL